MSGTETELHEKKISELPKAEQEPMLLGGELTHQKLTYYPGEEYIRESLLKQWAIAIVKEFRKSTKGKAWYADGYNVTKKDYLCYFLIDRFEITEEDLK